MRRLLDLLFSLSGMVIAFPFFLLLMLVVRLGSKGPIFYRQIRVGRYGRDFRLMKFRTMYVDADKKGLLTVGGNDARITPSGVFLRNYKLDELPQLGNVVRGKMSLVGPRPEVRKYVDMYTDFQKSVLNVRPGITDLASMFLSDENALLARSKTPERFYIEVIMPVKIRINQVYIKKESTQKYLLAIWWTILKIVGMYPRRLKAFQNTLHEWIDAKLALETEQLPTQQYEPATSPQSHK